MADACCNTIIGGLVELIVGDKTYQALGDVTISPMTVEREAGATSGARLTVTEKAKPATAAMNFANLCLADPMELFDMRCRVDVTVVEKSRGFRHLFSASAVVGTPEINLSTGELSGLQIATDSYTRTG